MAEERGGFAAGDPVPPRILSWHCAVYDHESSAQNTPVKGALGNQYPLTLCVLRTFHPARGGEAYGVLPGQSPRLRVVPIRTRGLVRRVIPFVGIAAVFAVAVGTGAPALLAFPLFLLAVLTVALFDDSGQLLAVGGAASLAILIITVTQLGPASNLATALFEIAVLGIVATSVHEVVRQAKLGEENAERKAVEIESIDERLRLTLEAALIGLGLVSADGHWVQINERLAGMLGHGRDELMHANLSDVVAETDVCRCDRYRQGRRFLKARNPEPDQGQENAQESINHAPKPRLRISRPARNDGLGWLAAAGSAGSDVHKLTCTVRRLQYDRS